MRGGWYAARQVTAALVVGDKDGNRSGKLAPPNNVRMYSINPYIYGNHGKHDIVSHKVLGNGFHGNRT